MTSTESWTHPHALRSCTVDVERTDRLLGKHSEEAHHDGMRQHPPWAGRAEVKQATVMRLLLPCQKCRSQVDLCHQIKCTLSTTVSTAHI